MNRRMKRVMDGEVRAESWRHSFGEIWSILLFMFIWTTLFWAGTEEQQCCCTCPVTPFCLDSLSQHWQQLPALDFMPRPFWMGPLHHLLSVLSAHWTFSFPLTLQFNVGHSAAAHITPPRRGASSAKQLKCKNIDGSEEEYFPALLWSPIIKLNKLQ